MITFLTGAGISAPSGVTTFRNSEGALWNSEYLFKLGHIQEASARPVEFWRAWGPLRKTLLEAQPNAAHDAITQLQHTYPHDVEIFTQNVDNLHDRSGSMNVNELHGTLFKNRCRMRTCRQPDWPDETPRRQPPTCPSCGAISLPAMTFFGENIERQAHDYALKVVPRSDIYIVVGSSGVVPPSANFVYLAKGAGAKTVLVNDHDWSDGQFDEVIVGSCDQTLPEYLSQF